ncbi:hypothetical protein DL764_001510 [Monosporascus ibericus]|uniref:Uncharacterized protein n=1 Tax=Monosporascus ibericus TaxID=155417 RepID=A0A4Q4TRK2_9PEZI|nr:hypothetical protein DL764_001510 [Monosporascus ibericus]
MENLPPAQHGQSSHHTAAATTLPEIRERKRSGSGGGILSKFPFMRTSESRSNLKESRLANAPDAGDASPVSRPQRSLSAALAQQQKTRKRKGSLRKVALLGRGAAREKREPKPLAVDNAAAVQNALEPAAQLLGNPVLDAEGRREGAHGLGISGLDLTPRPSMEGYARRAELPILPPPEPESKSPDTSPTISYTSTTDEEDLLSIPAHGPSPLKLSPLSSTQESYFHQNRSSSTFSLQRRRSVKHAKSPLSLQGLTASPIPAPDEDHDYSETEWWGWIILVVTWFVFVVGIGSCLNVWSWAWDVGATPYAPPEFEDDPTLPVVGYYPALIILTCIMAWVWVVVAWIGMKYFRHAKISGD